MPTIIDANLVVDSSSFAIVVARWNDFFADKLVSGAIDALVRHGADPDRITVVKCPGAFEVPMVCDKVARTGRFDGIIGLGVLIRGSTPHFDYISAEATKGIANVSLDRQIPISFGVLTVDTLEQAIERSGSKAGNKGEEAALAAVEMVNLYKQLDGLGQS